MIGFNQVDYTTDESAGTLMLSVSVQDGNIPEAENRIIAVTTSDGTAQCMLVLVALMNVDDIIVHVIFSIPSFSMEIVYNNLEMSTIKFRSLNFNPL